MRTFQLVIKRMADVVISLTAFIVLLPVFLILGVIIKCTSTGPVFFLQERLGLNGKVFKIIKFRTMVVNAEYIGEGLRVSSENDERITKIGRLLRATSLDELPQLLNVIGGSMSICGPRPPVKYHPYDGYEKYPEEYKKRFNMRPGITGLAQAMVRNSATWDERIEIDIQYVENYSLWLDIKVLFWTVMSVLKSKNIYGSTKVKKFEQKEETVNK